MAAWHAVMIWGNKVSLKDTVNHNKGEEKQNKTKMKMKMKMKMKNSFISNVIVPAHTHRAWRSMLGHCY